MNPDRPLRNFDERIWRELVVDLSRHLTKRNYKDLVDLAVIPGGVAEEITCASDAIQCVEQYGYMDKTKPETLTKALVSIRRRDLLPLISEYKNKLTARREKIPTVSSEPVRVNRSAQNLSGRRSASPLLLTPNSFTKGKGKVGQPSSNDEKLTEVEAGSQESYPSFLPSTNPINAPYAQVTASPRDCHVKSGLCLILNFEHFTSDLIDGRRLLDRTGSSVDRDNLEATFRWLGFEVESENNLTEKETRNILTEYACKDFSKYDAFACAILSHGFNGGVYTEDGNCLFIEDLRQIFTGSKNSSLIGKPKLFFIQACRGDNYDRGAEALFSDAPGSASIPSTTDFLFAFAVTPGSVSWRSESKGSWFISTLCKVLQEEARNETLPTILVHANYELSQQCGWPDNYLVKQGGEQSSSLNRVIYFHPKTDWKSFTRGYEKNGNLPKETADFS